MLSPSTLFSAHHAHNEVRYSAHLIFLTSFIMQVDRSTMPVSPFESALAMPAIAPFALAIYFKVGIPLIDRMCVSVSFLSPIVISPCINRSSYYANHKAHMSSALQWWKPFAPPQEHSSNSGGSDSDSNDSTPPLTTWLEQQAGLSRGFLTLLVCVCLCAWLLILTYWPRDGRLHGHVLGEGD